MLHMKYRALSLLALAIAAPGVALSDTVSSTLLSPGESSSRNVAVSQFDGELLAAVQAVRVGSGVGLLTQHDALSSVAAARARDMAERHYAADVTPEGETLLDAVRQADRQTLYSSFGSTIVVVEEGASAEAVLNALMSDPYNSANLLRDGFNHVGIGTVEEGGRLYIVQLLARVEGKLERPLPLNAGMSESLRAEFSGRGMTPVSWTVSDAEGATLLRGSGDRIRSPEGTEVEGYLDFDVALGQDVYTFRGPYVRVD